ncbi:MAG: hypothetical protein DDT20_00947 [Firmicutes bacterium]|nr:hypothetical protein [Bacillota bacterium]
MKENLQRLYDALIAAGWTEPGERRAVERAWPRKSSSVRYYGKRMSYVERRASQGVNRSIAPDLHYERRAFPPRATSDRPGDPAEYRRRAFSPRRVRERRKA